MLGDTGCRIKGAALQACNDPAKWPFPQLAAAAARLKPDLVIHVGDYLYRESACPPGNQGCAGSPWGYGWDAWQADFFGPAEALLAAAPWVVVRGNHEVCRRGGHGWMRLLDPHPARADCVNLTEPYRLPLGGLDLLLVDDADADDFLAPPDKVSAYAAQLVPFLATAPAHSWLLTHRPISACVAPKIWLSAA